MTVTNTVGTWKQFSRSQKLLIFFAVPLASIVCVIVLFSLFFVGGCVDYPFSCVGFLGFNPEGLLLVGGTLSIMTLVFSTGISALIGLLLLIHKVSNLGGAQ